MPPSRGHDLARPDTTIKYWTTGPADAPPVILLHGATLDHRAWDPQTEALQDRFHLVLPDLRGHGASDVRFGFEAAVADVLAMLDDLQLRPALLVGLSWAATSHKRWSASDLGRTCSGPRRHHLQHRGPASDAASLSAAAIRFLGLYGRA